MKVTVKKQSVSILRQILALPGWAKTIDDIYRGGKMLANDIPNMGPLDEFSMEEAMELEIDGPSRDLCKIALQHSIESKALPASAYASELIEALEFIPKKP